MTLTRRCRYEHRASARTLVIIPTYNERENLALIVDRLGGALPDAHILIVDDNSPDGTGELADELAQRDQRVHVLHRAAKSGLGRPISRGSAGALTRLSGPGRDGRRRQPSARTVVALARRGGRRRRPGHRITLCCRRRGLNWPLRRLVLSRTANLYSSLMLGTEIKDITAGFRAYRREVLEAISMGTVISRGYCFQIDLAWRAVRGGYRAAEVPITFVERERGVSKMSGSTIWEALVSVGRWGARSRLDSARGRYRRIVNRRAGDDAPVLEPVE